jgi:hypothetical protein
MMVVMIVVNILVLLMVMMVILVNILVLLMVMMVSDDGDIGIIGEHPGTADGHDGRYVMAFSKL